MFTQYDFLMSSIRKYMAYKPLSDNNKHYILNKNNYPKGRNKLIVMFKITMANR